jgi:hypothetical protein
MKGSGGQRAKGSKKEFIRRINRKRIQKLQPENTQTDGRRLKKQEHKSWKTEMMEEDNPMISDSLSEQFGPLSKLIVSEVIARLKQNGMMLSTAAAAIPEEEHLNLPRAAELLDHSYFWLSRNYKRLGLRPSRIGGKLLFRRLDLLELMKRREVRAPGRPRMPRLASP